ncbi:hypothetical protein [Salinicoccus sp. HZC-1]|uniref:hypothetical protein n=1 Tax=Salinicoccus sp. HZC-1 TaxID=3385497 RepID=UPI00398A8580
MNEEESMICDMETGICGPAGDNTENDKLKMIDFTEEQQKAVDSQFNKTGKEKIENKEKFDENSH